MMELLSICIPTYNRKNRLDELLREIETYKTDIPIIVVDNGSDDGTFEMIQTHQKKIKKLLYHRNEYNIGHDGNYQRIIEIGKSISHYSLWLGDDDRIQRNFFDEIPNILRNNEPDLLLLNSKPYVNNPIKHLIVKILGKEQYYSSINDTFIGNVKSLFLKYYNKMPFGCLVVNNKKINIETVRKYNGTYHLYSGAIWESLCNTEKEQGSIRVFILSKLYIVRGKGKKSYSNQMESVCFGVGKWYALLPDYLKESTKYAYKSEIVNKTYGKYTKFIIDGYKSIESGELKNNSIS